MSRLPTVAIIGRPNVGKSRLFNKLIGRRRAIVSEIPGTTRDQIAAKVETPDLDYLLIDTGGLGGGSEDKDLDDDVAAQSMVALEHADLILFTVDIREDLTSSDFTVADLLRKHSRPHVSVLLVLTKCDNPTHLDQILPQYYELGIGEEILAVSAAQGFGVEALQSAIVRELKKLNFSKKEVGSEKTEVPRIAVVGKPNVGKSSLINAYLTEGQREERELLVSEIPGTTRDSVDMTIRYHEREYTFIDTAGLKRRKSLEGPLDIYAAFRSIQAISECDTALLVLDALQPVSRQDQRIAGMVIEEGKGLIIVANKCDLLENEDRSQALKGIRADLPFCRFAPIIPTSAQTREGLLTLFPTIDTVQENRARRINTKELIRFLEDSVYGLPAASLISTKYITQAEETPPTFVLFVKDPKAVQVSQLRHLDNRLRERFPFEGTPVRWVTKASNAGS